MLVTTAMSGTRWRKVPSLSSASTTIHAPSSQTALVPISLTSPPIRNDGRRPDSTRIRASIEAVVVLPWVPATAMHRLRAAIPARVSARDSTGRPSRSASTTSGLSGPTAVERVSRSASPTLAASWPMATSTPSERSRSVTPDSRRSLPDTWCPMAWSTVAMALMPAPPTPTMWMWGTAVGSPTPAARAEAESAERPGPTVTSALRAGRWRPPRRRRPRRRPDGRGHGPPVPSPPGAADRPAGPRRPS